MADPAPFEITEAPGGARVASNATATLTVLDADGRLFRRRAVKGMVTKPCAEAALPMINQLAGDLLASLDMPSHVVAQRLAQIRDAIQPHEPTRVEWAVAELDGVRTYFDGVNVIVTRQDLKP